MSAWLTIAVTTIAAILGGGGTAAIVTSLARRGVTKAEAADRLTDSTLEWAEQLKKDAFEARRDASEARREAADARREMTAVRQEAELLARDIRRLRLAIQDPHTTLDRLRAMVGDTGVADLPAVVSLRDLDLIGRTIVAHPPHSTTHPRNVSDARRDTRS